MQRYLPKLMDNLAVNAAPMIPGRLNINQAPRSLLAGVPGLTPTAVEQILADRDVTLGQQRPEQVHETWLLSDGIVKLEEMKKLMPLVTTGGNVYRAQVVGFFDAEGRGRPAGSGDRRHANAAGCPPPLGIEGAGTGLFPGSSRRAGGGRAVAVVCRMISGQSG